LVINSKGSSPPNKEEKPLGSVYNPYMKGVSEKPDLRCLYSYDYTDTGCPVMEVSSF
jgi:hypothetical protein